MAVLTKLGGCWSADQSGCFVKIGSEEAPWSSSMEFEGGNTGHRPGTKGGYFPVTPVDTFQEYPSAEPVRAVLRG
jgi:glutamine synthetase